MTRAARVLLAAYAIDLVLGDPPWLPHPVRAIGWATATGERRWNGADARAGLRGGLLSAGIIAATGALAYAAVVGVRRLPPVVALVAEAAIGASALATTDLVREATAVALALEADDVVLARSRVARIVGRDTADLDATGIARATIETLAESTCDGIVAPLVWFAIGGVPAALAFKAASTLDSMIGHRDARFERFGAAAARIDDALNLVPARVSAIVAALLSGVPARSFGCAWRDAGAHASPNSGWPECAFAGALDVRLGGENHYAGERVDGAVFHKRGRAPTVRDIRRAIGLVRRTSLATALVLALALRLRQD
jgi:adenosylcobinamide-phosphate synthase